MPALPDLTGWLWLAVWLAVFSIPAFVLMGIDKSRAIRRRRRIPERAFFVLALLGGAAGVIGGMLAFRHKTLHRSFRIGVPLLGLLQLAAAVYLLALYAAGLR